MRHATSLVLLFGALCLVSIPLTASAQSDQGTPQSVPPESPPTQSVAADPSSTLQLSTPRAASAGRVFGDGRGAALEWNDRDPGLEPQPAGFVHFAIQAFGTLASSSVGLTPGLEIVPQVDLRLDTVLQLRVGAVVGAHLDQGVGDPNLGASSGHGVWFFGGRALIGLDARWFAFRVGGEIGVELLEHSLGEISLYGGGHVEMAFGLFGDGTVELVASFALQNRSYSIRPATGSVLIIQDEASARGGLGVGVMF